MDCDGLMNIGLLEKYFNIFRFLKVLKVLKMTHNLMILLMNDSISNLSVGSKLVTNPLSLKKDHFYM